jgi:hypothetical protein
MIQIPEIDGDLIVRCKRAMERACASLNGWNWRRQKPRYGLVLLAFRIPPHPQAGDTLNMTYTSNVPLALTIPTIELLAEKGREELTQQERGGAILGGHFDA